MNNSLSPNLTRSLVLLTHRDSFCDILRKYQTKKSPNRGWGFNFYFELRNPSFFTRSRQVGAENRSVRI